MADFEIAQSELLSVLRVLAEIAPLTPPMNPKGRYICTKALLAIQKAAESHTTALNEFLNGAVTQDEGGNPIFKDIGEGMRSFTVRPEFQQAYEDIQNEKVSFPTIRMITREELGPCPITMGHELVLLRVGLLEDKEPTT